MLCAPLRILLEGGVALKSMEDAFEILRSRPHGHLTAVLGAARALGLEKRLDRCASRMRLTADILARPTPLRTKALRLLGVRP